MAAVREECDGERILVSPTMGSSLEHERSFTHMRLNLRGVGCWLTVIWMLIIFILLCVFGFICTAPHVPDNVFSMEQESILSRPVASGP